MSDQTNSTRMSAAISVLDDVLEDQNSPPEWIQQIGEVYQGGVSSEVEYLSHSRSRRKQNRYEEKPFQSGFHSASENERFQHCIHLRIKKPEGVEGSKAF